MGVMPALPEAGRLSCSGLCPGPGTEGLLREGGSPAPACLHPASVPRPCHLPPALPSSPCACPGGQTWRGDG